MKPGIFFSWMWWDFFCFICCQILICSVYLWRDLSTCLADKKSQLEEDEQLARALQESLNVESPPQHGNGHVPYPYGFGQAFQPMPTYYSTGYRYAHAYSIQRASWNKKWEIFFFCFLSINDTIFCTGTTRGHLNFFFLVSDGYIPDDRLCFCWKDEGLNYDFAEFVLAVILRLVTDDS